uniref:Uncharacterized protein n=1 Tax=Ciona intestinalis TaxID=7719 RepID=H2XSD4_CIOIN
MSDTHLRTTKVLRFNYNSTIVYQAIDMGSYKTSVTFFFQLLYTSNVYRGCQVQCILTQCRNVRYTDKQISLK